MEITQSNVLRLKTDLPHLIESSIQLIKATNYYKCDINIINFESK